MKKILVLSGMILVLGIVIKSISPADDAVPDQSQISPPRKIERNFQFRAPHSRKEQDLQFEESQKSVAELQIFKEAFLKWGGAGDEVFQAQEAFSRRLSEEPSLATETLDFLRHETNGFFIPALGFLISQNNQPLREEVSRIAVEILQSNAANEQHEGALRLLGLFSPDPHSLQAVEHFAASDLDGPLRARALDVLGEWMRRPAAGIEEADDNQFKAGLATAVLKAVGGSHDPMLEGHAIQVFLQQDARPGASILEAFSGSLESDRENKILGGRLFSLAADAVKDFAVQKLELAYLGENDREVKFTFATNLIYLAKEDARMRLKALSHNDPEMFQQIESYLSSSQSQSLE